MGMICVIGDTHGDYSRFSHKKIKALKKGDYLVICGDFGFIWDGSDKEKPVLKKIGSKRYTTLFLAGSHDNYDLLEQYPEEDFLGGRARNICGNLYMLSSGYIFDIGEKKAFAFGGGQAVDIEARMENSTWWEQELPDEAKLEEGSRRIAEAGGRVDCIFTHEPPASLAEFLQTGTPSVQPTSRLNIYFDKMKNEVQFDMWFFGKLHKNKLIPSRYAAVFDEPYIME